MDAMKMNPVQHVRAWLYRAAAAFQAVAALLVTYGFITEADAARWVGFTSSLVGVVTALLAAVNTPLDAQPSPLPQPFVGVPGNANPAVRVGADYAAFPSRRRALTYAVAQWVMLLREEAAEAGGALRNNYSGVSELPAADLPADYATLVGALRMMPDAQLNDLSQRLAAYTVETVTGPVNRWDDPRIDDQGRWVVKRGPHG